MATKSKKSKAQAKRRLALPASVLRSIEEAKKNIADVQKRSAKEVEKLYAKVIEIDFVKKVRKNDVVRKAAKVGEELSHDVEGRMQKVAKELDVRLRDLRARLPFASRTEVDRLARKVNELSRRLDALTESEVDEAAAN